MKLRTNFRSAQIIRGRHKTSFRDNVYKVVRRIPNGKVMSYKELARLAGAPRSWRAVGNILRRSAELSRSHKNRDPKIPCHRVICTTGLVGGFRGGQKRKIELLKKEGIKNLPSAESLGRFATGISLDPKGRDPG